MLYYTLYPLLIAIFTLLVGDIAALPRLIFVLPFLLLLLYFAPLRLAPVYVSQIPPRLNNIPHTPLELLGLGKPAIDLPIPQHGGRHPNGIVALGSRLWEVEDGDNKGAACRGLEGDFAEGGRECGEELLSEL